MRHRDSSDHGSIPTPRYQRSAGRWLILVLGLLLAGCSDPDPAASEAALSRDEFIDVVVALRTAENELVSDTTVADSLFQTRFVVVKDSILRAHGTTTEKLYAFLERHPELAYQNELWDSITQRLKRPRPGAPAREEITPVPEDRPAPPSMPGRDRIRRDEPIPR